MKAIVCQGYGNPEHVLKLVSNLPKPETCRANQVIVKVIASSINPYDWHLIRGTPRPLVQLAFGLFKPNLKNKHNTPGCDVAGVIVHVGKNVTRFKINDEVFGDVSNAGFGGFAEFAVLPEHALTKKPPNISFMEAAACGVACTSALQAIEKHAPNMAMHSQVLVVGASGGVGAFITQMIVERGGEVVGVCSAGNVERVKAMGCVRVIDYKSTDMFKLSEQKFDYIFDCAANEPFEAYRALLSAKGVYVFVGGLNNRVFLHILLAGRFKSSKTGQRFVLHQNSASKPGDGEKIAEWLERGKIKPVMDDKQFDLQTVPQAIVYVEEKKHNGKVIIKI